MTNTGNVTLTGLALADTNTDDTPVCPATSLGPAKSTTCTAVHTVTQADIDAGGSVANTATATTSEGATGSDTLAIPISPEPEADHRQVGHQWRPTTASATVIAYSYTVTNSGNVTISAIAVSDDTVDAPPVCLATTLAPAASTTCTATYTVTQADLDAGKVTNSPARPAARPAAASSRRPTARPPCRPRARS